VARIHEFAQRVATDEVLQPPPEPHHIQSAALAALQKTGADWHQAGLVALATGLGKTWSTALDSRSFAPFFS
jgi:superfamily II DNA or RNA helicase